MAYWLLGLALLLSLAAALVLGWAAAVGEFEDVEQVKYRMLERDP